MRKLTSQQRAMLRALADADQWLIWQSLGYPYQVLDVLRTAGYVQGETWAVGYAVRITPEGKQAIEVTTHA